MQWWYSADDKSAAQNETIVHQEMPDLPQHIRITRTHATMQRRIKKELTMNIMSLGRIYI